MMYTSLAKPWQVCVDLAWEAYCAGSVPIAAVITNEYGEIVATGRNRLFETEQTAPYLSNTPRVQLTLWGKERQHDV